MRDWHLYIVRTRQGTLYTGIATDVARRLQEHGGGGNRGAKYLRARTPLTLAYETRIGDRALALRAEQRVKKLPRRSKEQIVATRPAGAQLLAMLDIAVGS